MHRLSEKLWWTGHRSNDDQAHRHSALLRMPIGKSVPASSSPHWASLHQTAKTFRRECHEMLIGVRLPSTSIKVRCCMTRGGLSINQLNPPRMVEAGQPSALTTAAAGPQQEERSIFETGAAVHLSMLSEIVFPLFTSMAAISITVRASFDSCHS